MERVWASQAASSSPRPQRRSPRTENLEARLFFRRSSSDSCFAALRVDLIARPAPRGRRPLFRGLIASESGRGLRSARERNAGRGQIAQGKGGVARKKRVECDGSRRRSPLRGRGRGGGPRTLQTTPVMVFAVLIFLQTSTKVPEKAARWARSSSRRPIPRDPRGSEARSSCGRTP